MLATGLGQLKDTLTASKLHLFRASTTKFMMMIILDGYQWQQNIQTGSDKAYTCTVLINCSNFWLLWKQSSKKQQASVNFLYSEGSREDEHYLITQVNGNNCLLSWTKTNRNQFQKMFLIVLRGHFVSNTNVTSSTRNELLVSQV